MYDGEVQCILWGGGVYIVGRCSVCVWWGGAAYVYDGEV